ncbi:choice-of-anchor L domain-containing protein [Flavobacterium sp. RHBU_3]|uniref:choice-of-anchor L domain-containing protein n=1 Tax=Flavobacterium sp. RHBU_3 TaxID=3391184 RepID=UPI003984C5E5
MKKFYSLAFGLLGCGLIAAQPANDDCSGAISIPVNADSSCTVTYQGVFDGTETPNPVADDVCSANHNDIWFEFAAVAETCQVSVDPYYYAIGMAVFSGECGGLTQLGCNAGTVNLSGLTIGETYKIMLYYIEDSPIVSPLPLGFTLCVHANNSVVIDDMSFTDTDLANTLLMNSECIGISNIVVQGNTAGEQSVGVFYAGEGNFPFEAGLVMSTGLLQNIPGPTNYFFSSPLPSSGSDADLAALNAAQGSTGQLYDTSSIAFDFVPLIPQLSFDFLFASNEYGIFQCYYADIFAFLLTDLETGEVTNLAVVPGTTTPISVTTIRDTAYNSACTSVNAEYFGEYYLENITAPINMRGGTVPITAQANVVPGHQYHIKMAIADYLDQAMDSAIFLSSASFDIGTLQSEFYNIISSGGNQLCNGSSTMLSIPYVEGFTYQWNYNGEPVEGATGNMLSADQAGEYSVDISSPYSPCVGVQLFSLEFVITDENIQAITLPPLTTPVTTTGTADFDLAAVQAQALAALPLGFSISFFATAADAQAGVNPLPATYTVPGPAEYTVYTRLQNDATGCYVIGEVALYATITSGVNNNTFAAFSCYPNPATDAITLTNGTTITQVELYNLLGQKQLSQQTDATTVTLPVTALAKGVYLLKVYSGSESQAVRFIKE